MLPILEHRERNAQTFGLRHVESSPVYGPSGDRRSADLRPAGPANRGLKRALPGSRIQQGGMPTPMATYAGEPRTAQWRACSRVQRAEAG